MPSTMWSGLPTTVLRCSVYISTAAEPSAGSVTGKNCEHGGGNELPSPNCSKTSTRMMDTGGSMTPLPVFTGRERFMVTLLIPTRCEGDRNLRHWKPLKYTGQIEIDPITRSAKQPQFAISRHTSAAWRLLFEWQRSPTSMVSACL